MRCHSKFDTESRPTGRLHGTRKRESCPFDWTFSLFDAVNWATLRTLVFLIQASSPKRNRHRFLYGRKRGVVTLFKRLLSLREARAMYRTDIYVVKPPAHFAETKKARLISSPPLVESYSQYWVADGRSYVDDADHRHTAAQVYSLRNIQREQHDIIIGLRHRKTFYGRYLTRLPHAHVRLLSRRTPWDKNSALSHTANKFTEIASRTKFSSHIWSHICALDRRFCG